jgi:predicted nucleic acid-binding protein
VTLMLVDVSALTRMHVPAVADAVEPYVLGGDAATCAITDAQLFAGMGDPAVTEKVAAVRSAAFRWLPTHDDDLRAASTTQLRLRNLSMNWPTLIVASVALRQGATVLHYDECFDTIARATGQPMQWVVPPGTIPEEG